MGMSHLADPVTLLMLLPPLVQWYICGQYASASNQMELLLTVLIKNCYDIVGS